MYFEDLNHFLTDVAHCSVKMMWEFWKYQSLDDHVECQTIFSVILLFLRNQLFFFCVFFWVGVGGVWWRIMENNHRKWGGIALPTLSAYWTWSLSNSHLSFMKGLFMMMLWNYSCTAHYMPAYLHLPCTLFSSISITFYLNILLCWIGRSRSVLEAWSLLVVSGTFGWDITR